MLESKRRLILLQHCRGIGWNSINLIVLDDPLLDRIFQKKLADWAILLPHLTNLNLSLFFHDLHSLNISSFLKKYSENHIFIISIFDKEYPERLRNIFNPPWILFCKGNILLLKEKRFLAVVGPRIPSVYGQETVKRLMPGLISREIVIISGLAKGIDRMAHEAAMAQSGDTVAVLGGGLFHLYPKENMRLALQMMKEQLVLSEIVPDRRPEPWMFPLRNRIISGLSDGVLIIEAKRRSGSLITAHAALEQGRGVFAVPGPINSPLSEGTNLLIQDGAKLVQSSCDIEEELFPLA